MGRATRWLKGLFGMNKKKENSSQKRASTLNNLPGLSQNLRIMPPNLTSEEAAWLRSFYEDDNVSDTEQRKQAIAVAAATAAAADAAVAAAQAAAVVVRLSSQGRGAMLKGCKENLAAVKIQTIFRSFLARKALKALKGVVKLQAIVRGFLARKQAHATLVIVEALRAQMDARAQKCRGLIPNHEECPLQSQPRKSLENSDDLRVEHRVIPRHSRRLSSSFEISNVMKDVDECPKIVEVDTVMPKSRNRTKSSVSEQSDDDLANNHKKSSPLACPNAPRMSTPDRWNFNQFFESEEHMLVANECRLSTAKITPCFVNSSNAPLTPTNNACVDGYSGNINEHLVPSYMASTQSFKAKLRSQSAPKLRPEPPSRRRLSLEKMESRCALSGLRRQRSYSHAQEVVNFKNVVSGKLGRSCDFANEQMKDYHY